MEFRILGPLEAVAEGQPVPLRGAKERVLLVRLVIGANRVVALDTLIDDLWGPDAPEEAASTLRVYVSRLRKHLRQGSSDDLIQTQPPGYLLSVDRGAIDAYRFEQLATEAREELRRGQASEAARLAREALALWRGPALGDAVAYAFAQLESARLSELQRATVEDRIEADLAAGGNVELVGELASLVEVNPYRERLWRLFMLALYRSGRQAEALRAYQRVRTLLAEDLGIEPSQDLVNLERDILMQSPDLGATVTTPRRPAPGTEGVAATAPLPQKAVRAVLVLRPSPALGHFHPEHLAMARSRGSQGAGHEVTHANEGQIVAVFSDPVHALAAVAGGLGVGHAGFVKWVRGGLHGEVTGETPSEGADDTAELHHTARQLADSAPAGHILISPGLARLARTTGLRVRKSMPDGENASDGTAGNVGERRYELDLDAVRPEPALELLPVARTGPFVGRLLELDTFANHWDRARGSQLQCAVVTGDPGIGKTRLLREVAGRVWDDGGIVLTGRCDEGSVVPFQPIVSAVAQYLGRAGSRDSDVWALPGASELAALLPRSVVPGVVPARMEADANTARYWLFEAFFTVFDDAARQAPLLIMVDDLQWADPSTVRLLCHLAERGAQLPILVAATCRVNPREQTGALAELRRVAPTTEVPLQGLPDDHVRKLMLEWTKHAPTPQALAQLQLETGGNPFFIGELLAAEGSGLGEDVEGGPLFTGSGVPARVMDLVGRRVEHLAESAKQLVEAAAVVGRSFRIDVVEAACQMTDEVLLDAIDGAVEAGLVEEDTERGPGNYLFAHTIIQRGVYERLGPGRRTQLHKRIGNILLERFGTDRGPHLSEMARHLSRGQVGAEDRRRALEAMTAAGRQALGQLAYEEAAGHFRAALQLLDDTVQATTQERVQLLLALAEAWSRAGQLLEARAVLGEAEGLARREGRGDLLAQVVLAGTREPWGLGFTLYESERAPALAGAIEALGDDSAFDELRSALLAHQAIDFYISGERPAGQQAAKRAVVLADRCGAPSLSYQGRVALLLAELGPELSGTEQLERSDQLLEMAAALPGAGADLSARQLRLGALLQQGDVEGFGEEVANIGGIATSRSLPTFDYWWRVYQSTAGYLAGRLGEAEEAAVGAFAAGQRIDESTAVAVFGAQMILILWARGSLGSILDSAGSLSDQFARVAVFRAALAFMHAEEGRPEARQHLAHFVDQDFASLPLGDNWLTGMFMLGMCSARLGDAKAAAGVAERLAPYAERAVVTSAGVVFLGSAALALGAALRTGGRLEEADAALAQAVTANQAMGHRPMEALALFEHGLCRRAMGDGDGADHLAQQSTRLAEELQVSGMLAAAARRAEGAA